MLSLKNIWDRLTNNITLVLDTTDGMGSLKRLHSQIPQFDFMHGKSDNGSLLVLHSALTSVFIFIGFSEGMLLFLQAG